MISVDWANKVVESTDSILDLPAFKEAIRVLESSATGVLYDPIITYKLVSLGNGGYLHAVDLINGYSLKFIGAGPFYIDGQLGGTIIPTGVQVERRTSAAFVTTSTEGGGSGGLTVEQAGQLLAILTDVAKLAKLEGLKGVPVVTRDATVGSPGSREAGDILQTVELAEDGTVTLSTP